MIPTEPLRRWLPGQRWFAGKDRDVDRLRLVSETVLRDGDPGLCDVVVGVAQGDSEDYYQLLLGYRTQLPEYLRPHVIATVDNTTVYSALPDPELMGVLLDHFQHNHSGLAFQLEPGVSLESGLHARLIATEQTNSSVVFGQRYILKLFRRLHIGPHRDLELHRALRSVGSTHIAEPLGCIQGDLAGQEAVFGMLQRFLSDAADGWTMATASVRDLMAEGDLHADEVGGDFAGEAHRLGAAVAKVHADLAEVLGTGTLNTNGRDAVVSAMHHRLDAMLTVVPQLAEHESVLRKVFDEARVAEDTVTTAIHGDLHLGQTLRSTNGWVLIDFEGEPAAPVAERHGKRSPLVDVAGMLRSFDYAAHQHLVGQAVDNQHAVRAREWAERNIDAFCDGYGEQATDPREHITLLRAFELDKAVYEVGYEKTHRPDWLEIPLSAIGRLLD